MTIEHKDFIKNIHDYTRILKWKCWINNIDEANIYIDLIDFLQNKCKLQGVIPKNFFSEKHYCQLKPGNMFYLFFYENKINHNVIKKIYFLKPALSQIEIKKRKEILELLKKLK